MVNLLDNDDMKCGCQWESSENVEYGAIDTLGDGVNLSYPNRASGDQFEMLEPCALCHCMVASSHHGIRPSDVERLHHKGGMLCRLQQDRVSVISIS